MPCRRQYRAWRSHPCTVAYSDTKQPPAQRRRRQASKQPFKACPIGYFHIDIAEVQTEEGKLYLFLAVDRIEKYTFARLMKRATNATARAS